MPYGVYVAVDSVENADRLRRDKIAVVHRVVKNSTWVKKYERYYGPGMECAQQLWQLAVVRTLSWLAGMLWLAVVAASCTCIVQHA